MNQVASLTRNAAYILGKDHPHVAVSNVTKAEVILQQLKEIVLPLMDTLPLETLDNEHPYRKVADMQGELSKATEILWLPSRTFTSLFCTKNGELWLYDKDIYALPTKLDTTPKLVHAMKRYDARYHNGDLGSVIHESIVNAVDYANNDFQRRANATATALQELAASRRRWRAADTASYER